jgi:hypothetical protein
LSAAGPIEPEVKLPGRPFEPGNGAARGHGAPVGNANSLKHGLRASRRQLTLGKLPRGCAHVVSRVGALRRILEDLHIEHHGDLDYKAELIIQSACRHEQAALLAQRWLRISADTMNHAERLQYLQAIANESDKRDKSIAALKLDRDPQTLIGSLYASTTTSIDDEQ